MRAEMTRNIGCRPSCALRLPRDAACLRQLLDAEVEARRRTDHLLAGALERLAAWPATAGPDVPTSAHQDAERAGMPAKADDAVSPWWVRLHRWLAGG
jgi:hypothetical protein